MPKLSEIHPFSQRVPIIGKFNEKALLARINQVGHANFPEANQLFRVARENAQKFLRHGLFDVEGNFLQTPLHLQSQFAKQQVMAEAMAFVGGFHRDQTPDFFNRPDFKSWGTFDDTIDMSFLQFMVAETMDDLTEERDDWDARFTVVAMDEKGEVELQPEPLTSTNLIRNAEYGIGMAFKWTWLETNKFGLRMNSFIPKMKYEVMKDMSDTVWDDFVATMTTVFPPTHHVIRDLNAMRVQLMRTENAYGKTEWENASFVLIFPPEFRDVIDMAFRLNENNLSTDVMQFRPILIESKRLPHATVAEQSTVYLGINKWKKNGLYTRVPFTLFGPENDITKFSSIMTGRWAWGKNFDATSFLKVTFDRTHADFTIGGPISTHEVP